MSLDPSRNFSAASARRKKSVAEEPVTSVLPAGDVPYDPDHEWNEDEEVLAALGYKPEFKREFSLFTTFCVSFAVLGLLPSFATTLYYGMGYAGTGGMTWGWVIAMVGIQCVASSMAELCSSMPTSGGLYYAAAVLAPPGWGPLAAWVTGWSNWLVQITGAPSVDYGTAAMTLAAASIYNPSYVPQNYHVFLVTTLLMIIHAIMSSMPTAWLAKTNSFGSTFNFFALIVVIIIIPAATNRTSQGLPKFTPSSEVWGTIQNGTDWPDGIAVLMSFIAVLWTMSGYDAPFHLAEECSNANVASPRAIVMTSALGGIFGWFLQIVVAYTVVDINAAISSDLGQPFAAYLQQCMPPKIAMAILALTIIAGFFMGQGCMIAASRVTFAYARDGCFPGSKYWSHVNHITKTPVNAVWFNCAIGIAMLLLIFGGSLTIGALFSVGAIAAEVAFTTPIMIRVFFVGNRFRRGPWHLGKFSIPIGVVACSFVLLMIPILNFPVFKGSDLNAADMNWTVLVYGGPMFFVLLYWVIDARKWFKGPRVNVQHLMLGRDENLIEGKGEGEGDDSSGNVHGIDDKVATEGAHVAELPELLEARLEQADLLKKVVDAIKDLVQDCNFDCNDSGIALQAMDNSHVALVSMMLKSESFSPFRCDRNIALGINLTSLTKVLRAAQSNDILTLKAEDAPDVVDLQFESANADRISEYAIKLMDIDQEHLGIPETEYAATITMPSTEFQRICRDLMAISESVGIEATKEGVKFNASGDIGSGSVTLRQHTNVEKPEENVEIDLSEPVALTFSLKYLVNFCKATGLSGSVKLCLSHEVPLLVEYALSNNSYLRFYLAPKIGDEE